jgi:hypothetical protein
VVCKSTKLIILRHDGFGWVYSEELIKICCAALSCGAMIANTYALTLAGVEKEEGRIR